MRKTSNKQTKKQRKGQEVVSLHVFVFLLWVFVFIHHAKYMQLPRSPSFLPPPPPPPASRHSPLTPPPPGPPPALSSLPPLLLAPPPPRPLCTPTVPNKNKNKKKVLFCLYVCISLACLSRLLLV